MSLISKVSAVFSRLLFFISSISFFNKDAKNSFDFSRDNNHKKLLPLLLIDARLSGIRHGGIGRYIEELVRGLVELPRTCRLSVIFFDLQQASEVLNLQMADLVKVANNEYIVRHLEFIARIYIFPTRHYSLAEQIFLPILLMRIKPNLIHFPHFNVPIFCFFPYVLTIHDLLWHERIGGNQTTLKPVFYWFKYFGYRIVTFLAVTRAKNIFVPSFVVFNNVNNVFFGVKNKILVTYEGVSSQFFQSSVSLKKLNRKQLLYVGSLYPHKNVDFLLEILLSLPTDFVLTVITPRSVFVDSFILKIKQLQLVERVRVVVGASDEQLKLLVSQSGIFVQPSLSEGFGLPVLEALAQGLPALVSDIPIFREIYKEEVAYFSISKDQGLVQAVENIKRISSLSDSDYLKLSADGRSHARKFNWSSMVAQTIASYKENFS